jgi:hypothetical protein
MMLNGPLNGPHTRQAGTGRSQGQPKNRGWQCELYSSLVANFGDTYFRFFQLAT